MDIPDIIDDRPHKAVSMRSNSPTIVLDDVVVDAEMHAKSLCQDHHNQPNGVAHKLDKQVQQLDINGEER